MVTHQAPCVNDRLSDGGVDDFNVLMWLHFTESFEHLFCNEMILSLLIIIKYKLSYGY